MRTGDLAAEAAEDLGEPCRRVRVTRTVLGVAVKREIGQHDAEAPRECVYGRLPLAMSETERVQEHKRPSRPRLAIGDPRPVPVVVQAQAHAVDTRTEPV